MIYKKKRHCPTNDYGTVGFAIVLGAPLFLYRPDTLGNRSSSLQGVLLPFNSAMLFMRIMIGTTDTTSDSGKTLLSTCQYGTYESVAVLGISGSGLAQRIVRYADLRRRYGDGSEQTIMGLILPVNHSDYALGMGSIRPSAKASAQAPVDLSPAGPAAAGMVDGATAAMNVMAQVSELLSGIGGGLENDKMLRMMIALLILLALLNEQQGVAERQNQALEQLGRGGAGQQFLIQQTYSETSISIEQTTVTTVAYGITDAVSSGNSPQDTGGQIDLSI